MVCFFSLPKKEKMFFKRVKKVNICKCFFFSLKKKENKIGFKNININNFKKD
jgi:hypothetical protein